MAVTGVRHGAVGQLGVYYYFIEVLVESSALFSISLVLELAFTVRRNVRLYYFNAIAGIAKGVAPTLLVGQAAAGHTCPRDDSGRSTVSSLHFQTSSEPGTTSFQHEESAIQSSVLVMDIKAQPEWQATSIEQHTMMSMMSQANILD
ncbi:hypothetical protein EDD85DRAFT_793161 [Armillaria nabsnona]|nr:hypothetical protein EDD85DRAFT_793161 [Armillaria nabsnona]